MIFGCADPRSLLLSDVGPETFVVCAADTVIGKDVYTQGSFDFEKFERVVKILGRSDFSLLIDVGANIGTISIPAVSRGFCARARCFEPDPFNFGLLSANIHLNGLGTRIEASNLALGDRDGQTLQLALSEANFGDHRIVLNGSDPLDEPPRKTVLVASETLDKVVVVDDPASTLLWMDTQGCEGLVLAGASSILRKRVPLVVEFWPCGLKRTGSYAALKSALLSAGYRSFVNLNASDEAVCLTEEALDDLYHSLGEDWPFTDLLVQ